jgi:hypothetical protein
MGFATHLGPWLLGTVKDTTGTTAGTVRNTGATAVAQTNSDSFGFAAVNSSLTGTAFCLPAGAIITNAQFFTSAAYSAAVTIKLTMGGQDIYTATTVTGPAAPYSLAAGTTAAVVALLANVGSTDQLVTYTLTKAGTLTTGAGTLVITYVVRGSDGVGYPVGNQN